MRDDDDLAVARGGRAALADAGAPAAVQARCAGLPAQRHAARPPPSTTATTPPTPARRRRDATDVDGTDDSSSAGALVGSTGTLRGRRRRARAGRRRGVPGPRASRRRAGGARCAPRADRTAAAGSTPAASASTPSHISGMMWALAATRGRELVAHRVVVAVDAALAGAVARRRDSSGVTRTSRIGDVAAACARSRRASGSRPAGLPCRGRSGPGRTARRGRAPARSPCRRRRWLR